MRPKLRPFLVQTFSIAVMCVAGGISAIVVGFLPMLPMSLISSTLFIAAIAAVVVITRWLTKQRAKLEAVAYSVSTVGILCVTVPVFARLASFDETARDLSMYTPQLYDRCSTLRGLFECGKQPDPLSKLLSAARCLDFSMMSVPLRELKRGHVDLDQQCFGG